MSMIHLKLDSDSPIPLYHQIAEAIRYRVATGEIPVGSVLPPLRDAAGEWGVNLHTVRRAYAELADAGIVATRAPVGTQVLPPVGRSFEKAGDMRVRFVRKVIAEAHARHGLGVQELIEMIERNRPVTGSRASATVYVSECSETQSTDLARQVEERWRVTALPWPISRAQPPRPDPILATYFHYNDLRTCWPERFPDVHFAAIRPDPDLGRRIRSRRRGEKGPLDVLLFEKEEAMLRNIASDISRVLPRDRFRLTTRIAKRGRSLVEGIGQATSVLVAPRIWGDLPESVRRDPRVYEIRYLFDPKEIDSIARDLAWASR